MLVGMLVQGISYFMQGDFGLFVASFSVREGGSYCIVQLFEPMDSFGIPITNDYYCPLLSLTSLFHCIPAHYICNPFLSFMNAPQHVIFNVYILQAQWKDFLSLHRNMFVHDFSNNLYSFNVYCMHSV